MHPKREINEVDIRGKIINNSIKISTTNDGDPAGTFLLNIPATVGRDTLVRVNMFGGRLIKLLKRVQVANANWVFVKGELMVRDKKDDGSGRDVRLEVRGQKLFFDLAADANDSSEEEES